MARSTADTELAEAPRSNDARRTAIALAAFLLLALSAPVVAIGSEEGDVAAFVIGLRGEVEVFVAPPAKPGQSPGREWVRAEVGHVLRLQDRVRTRRGRVRIEFTDNWKGDLDSHPSIFILGDDTELAIEEFDIDYELGGNSRVVLDQIRGWLQSFIRGHGGQSGFSIRAGVAVIGVRGTELTTTYQPEGEVVHVEVVEGEVVLTGPGGSRLIRAGESATMVDGALPAGPPS
jgi:hypothetical protein